MTASYAQGFILKYLFSHNQWLIPQCFDKLPESQKNIDIDIDTGGLKKFNKNPPSGYFKKQ
jgi:hypothetical protein